MIMIMLWEMQCLQYATDQIADLKKIEKLNNKFFRIMATGQDSAGRAMHIYMRLSVPHFPNAAVSSLFKTSYHTDPSWM